MNKTIIVTGANAGLGKEAAKQLALKNETEKIYLACRNESKAKLAKAELEEATGRSIFEIMLVDVSNPESVTSAVTGLDEPVDALIMNAGGMGGRNSGELTEQGVSRLFAANVLGHVVMLEALLKSDKLRNVAMYAGSEGARGVKKMGMKRPNLKSYSVEEFTTIFDASFFEENFDPMELYSHVKYAATLWMSALARKYPQIKFITMSPGATSGTNVMDDLPFFKKIMFKYVGFPVLMPLLGMVHSIEKGAARYVQAISDDSLVSGKFYASSENRLTGPVMDQADIFPDLANETYQDNAYAAVLSVAS